MDFGWLPLAAFILTAIGWISRELWRLRTAKRQAAYDASTILKERKTLLENMVAKTEDSKSQQALIAKLNEVEHALLGLYGHRLRQTLKDASLPSEDFLIAQGLRQAQSLIQFQVSKHITEMSLTDSEIKGLQEDKLTQLKEALSEAESLSEEYLDRDFLMLLGLVYFHVKQFRDAELTYTRVLNENDNDFVALANRGTVYSYIGEPYKALSDYDRALQIQRNNVSIIRKRGFLYNLMKKYNEALKDFNHALKIEPNNPGILADRGAIYVYLNRVKEALNDFNRSIKIRPNDKYVYNNRGTAYAQLGQTDKALADYNRALELDTTFYTALINRGGIFQRSGMYEAAYTDYICAWEDESERAQTSYNLARLLSLQGKSDEALYYLKYMKKLVDGDEKYWDIIKIHNDFNNIRDNPRFKKL